MKIIFSICFNLLCLFGFAQNSGDNNIPKQNLINSVFYEEIPVTNKEDLKDIPKEYWEMTKNIKQVPIYYELLFNESEALYKKVEKKNGNTDNDMSTGNMQIKHTVITLSGIAETYKNFKTNTSTASKTILDKEFLVSEKLQKMDWTLINEVKIIGSLECKKAEKKNGNDITEAWYAPSIPTMAGPSVYWGLPGLIVEVKSKSRHYVATEIKENVAGSITIPIKGKKVNPEEFQKQLNENVEEYKKTMPPMNFGRN